MFFFALFHIEKNYLEPERSASVAGLDVIFTRLWFYAYNIYM